MTKNIKLKEVINEIIKVLEKLLENIEKSEEVEFMRKAQNLKYKYFRMGYLICMSYQEQELL